LAVSASIGCGRVVDCDFDLSRVGGAELIGPGEGKHQYHALLHNGGGEARLGCADPAELDWRSADLRPSKRISVIDLGHRGGV
jgi:hypothetical protein